ncbi:MAG TPA: hypothetical protein VF902_07040, partial [Coriobacteriia bacterium]
MRGPTVNHRSTQAIALALTLVVGALVAISPLCLVPACAKSMSPVRASADMSACPTAPSDRIAATCNMERPATITAVAGRPALDLPGLAATPVVAAVSAGSEGIRVAAA